jgi:uncharacterized protein YodC (DUF2158 family)
MTLSLLSLPSNGGVTIFNSKNLQIRPPAIQDYYFAYSDFHCATLVSHMAQFNVGDVVQLKSGGPRMTVNRQIGPVGSIFECAWFVGTDLKTGQFSESALQPWKEPERQTLTRRPPGGGGEQGWME